MSEDASLDQFIGEEDDEDSVQESRGLEQEQFGPFTLSTPGEWTAKRLGDIKNLITRGKQPTYADEGVPVINQECIYWDGWHFENLRFLEPEVAEDWKEKYFPNPGDVILNSTGQGTLGRAQVYPDNERRAIDSHVTLIRTERELNPYFHRYFLESHLGQALLYSMCVNGSTGQIELSKTRLDLLPTPLPPLEEQNKIATVLDNLDQAILKIDELLDQVLRLKKAVAQDLFHEGLRSSETKSTWLGELPEEWDTVKFSELIQSSRNGVYKKQDAYGSGVPILKMGDMFGEITFGGADMERVEMENDEIDKYRLKQGDLLFARRSLNVEGAGECTLIGELDEPTVFESSLIRVRLNNEVDPMFLAQYFEGPVGSKSIERIVTTTTASGIAGSDLKKLPVPHPPKEVQKEIASKLTVYDKKTTVLERRKKNLQRLKQGLMQDLLSGTVRTTNTNIEIPDKIAQDG
ncbi:restriction endonuclease subunit S [Salinilacihabitans rarus]|uniref:restriction endonuclease subunit S n=1 Tax=Salinilacihabitans rarus TaxID=2961596 RepID=UPI0020C8964A|nr:restriction endonuclease subunit S [Salinilacihabitans rarus]